MNMEGELLTTSRSGHELLRHSGFAVTRHIGMDYQVPKMCYTWQLPN
jgi:hypothetical protein